MIKAEALCKSYGSFEAVKDVSFTADFPGILGLLGPNGAGKTTLLKILSGCRASDSGTLFVGGLSMEDNAMEIKSRLGYLPENNPLYGDMSPRQYLEFLAGARLLQKEKKRKAVNRAIESCGLENFSDKRIDTLSKGYRQRTGLAASLVHDPPLLILDEPTSGLDPNQTNGIRSLIRELGKRKTIVLSTHFLGEAEALCGRIIIMNEGRASARGTPGEISAAVGDASAWELVVKGGNPEKIRASLESAQWKVSSISAVSGAQGGEGVKIKLVFPEASGSAQDAAPAAEVIFDWALSQNLKILAMNKTQSSLEDVFVKLTGRSGGRRKDAAPGENSEGV